MKNKRPVNHLMAARQCEIEKQDKEDFAITAIRASMRLSRTLAYAILTDEFKMGKEQLRRFEKAFADKCVEIDGWKSNSQESASRISDDVYNKTGFRMMEDEEL